MKNMKNVFSGILVGVLLVGGIGALWFNEGTDVKYAKAPKYNAFNYVETK